MSESKKVCEHFKAKSIFEQNLCHYWKTSGRDHRGDPYPAHCSNKNVIVCDTYGFKVLPRDDSDSDGEL